MSRRDGRNVFPFSLKARRPFFRPSSRREGSFRFRSWVWMSIMGAEPGDRLAAEPILPQAAEQHSLRARCLALSIEGAIQSYLQEQRANERSVKTLEWHQTALGLFQQYLVDKRHLHLLCQITEAQVRGWVAFLGTTPSTKDTTRSAGTIVTYARSARAFCHWAVRNGYLESLPIVRGTMPKARRKLIHVIEPEEFERLLLACRAAGERDAS